MKNDIVQYGAITGRFSCKESNFSDPPKDENNFDWYIEFASQYYNIPKEDVTKEQRAFVKERFYLMNHGGDSFVGLKLTDKKDAEDLFNKFYKQFEVYKNCLNINGHAVFTGEDDKPAQEFRIDPCFVDHVGMLKSYTEFDSAVGKQLFEELKKLSGGKDVEIIVER